MKKVPRFTCRRSSGGSQFSSRLGLLFRFRDNALQSCYAGGGDEPLPVQSAITKLELRVRSDNERTNS